MCGSKSLIAAAVLVSTSAGGWAGDAADPIARRVREVATARQADGGAGVVDRYPYLCNDKVAFVWSRAEKSGGLLSIYDRRTGREFLEVDPSRAPFWEVTVKSTGGGERKYSNLGAPCTVTVQDNNVKFVWERGLRVQAVARLARDDMQVRMRLHVRALEADEGLLTVTFPNLHGIAPITQNAERDTVLAFDSCRREVSPLRSGRTVEHRWPLALQFSALLADGVGLYVAEEDPSAVQKTFTWSPEPEEGSLGFSVPHPVLGWGGPELVKEYASPGDVVIGPFHGDWYDAARLYRNWALTAPWCAKGPIHARQDFPQWLADASYWTLSRIGFDEGIEEEIEKQDAFGLPLGVCHDYGFWYAPHQDDRYPDYFPPRLGAHGLERAVARLHGVGMKVVPYVNGTCWDRDSESWDAEDAQRGAVRGAAGELAAGTWFEQPFVNMCPGSRLWRTKLVDIARELVGRYDMDGVYFDYLTTVPSDCYNADHEHAIAGGGHWIRSIRQLYAQVRSELKEIKPEAMVTAENIAEWVIDLLDTALYVDAGIADAPMFAAVYHGYTLTYGAMINNYEPYNLGRTWLRGSQSGWNNTEMQLVYALKGEPISGSMEKSRQVLPCAQYYRKLLHCGYYFGRSYLVYGEMLRPPRIEGDFPAIDTAPRWQLSPVPAVEGSAWLVPDGSVGVFFTNYDKENAYEVTWSLDLEEGAGWDAETRLMLSVWDQGTSIRPAGEMPGGRLTRQAAVDALGLIALKLEVVE